MKQIEPELRALLLSYLENPTDQKRNDIYALVKSHLEAIVTTKYQRYNRRIDREELVTYAFLGLVSTLRNLDASRIDSFYPYLNLRVCGEMVDNMRAIDRVKQRQLKKKGATESLFSVCSIDADSSDYDHIFGDSVAAEDPSFSRMDERDTFEQIISELDERDKQLLRLAYIEDVGHVRISEILGLSESRVSQMHKKLRIRLMQEISGSSEVKPLPRMANRGNGRSPSKARKTKRFDVPDDLELTPPERRYVELMNEGKTDLDIALELDRAITTVEHLRMSISKKAKKALVVA